MTELLPAACQTVVTFDQTWPVVPLTLGSGITASEPTITCDGKDYYKYSFLVTLNGGLPEGSPAEGETDGYVLGFNGRTLYKDGTWNTLCLPFGISNFTGTPLEGATVMELDATGTYDTDKKTGFDAATGTLYLYFKTATAIEAGRPYIVKWTKPDGYDLAPYEHDIYSPVFSGAAITAAAPTAVTSEDGRVTYMGSYAPVALTTSDDLLIGSDNTLHHPAADGTQLNAFRAYLSIPALIGLEQLTDAVLGKAASTAVSDVNGDLQTDILDITALIDYLTGHGLVKHVVSNVDLGLGH